MALPQAHLERILKTVKNYDMVRAGDTVLAAVSGGPDSVFLLHALAGLKKKLGIRELWVCNLDHCLRGEESEADSGFVKEISKDLGVGCIHERIDIRAARKRGLSTEESAREERYKFFARAAKRCGAGVVATGHTLDDQAETVLMRIVKGTALKGMAGIAPVREEGAIRVIRPLIELEKSEIKDCLDKKGVPYRIDSTNVEPVYFRNVVRSEIIPFLEKYNPRLKRSLSNLAEHLREDLEFINEEKAKAREGKIGSRNGRLTIKLKDLVVQPKALQKEILRDMLGQIGGEVKKLSFRHWKEIEHFIRYNRKGNALDLPGGVRLERTGETLEFYLL
ncbi:MAG: tRNA lysidine(34) synthetase TilS [Candidatus Omnitrophota bacterium]